MTSEVEQHFSFQRTQLLTDQSHEEEEDVDFTGALAETDNNNLTGDLMSEDQDYGESFAEEFKLKQAKMLGELQSIYDVKTGLSEKLRGLTVQDPDDDDPSFTGHHGLLILDKQASMPEAVK